MKTIIQIMLFALVLNSLSAQVNCTIPPEYLDNNKPAVLAAWEQAGTSAFNGGSVIVEDGIRADDPGIYTWGQYINKLITDKPFDGYYYIYFPAGVYHIYETLNLDQDKIILKGDGADPWNNPENSTQFVFCHAAGVELQCISIAGNFCGIDDIAITNVICEADNGVIFPAIPPHEESLEDFYTSEKVNKEKGDGYTINISGNNNWIRGVYSEYTQKMHVYISGTHNTVTGCYFTGSWSYGSGGYGYGVCLSNASDNLIENNVFYSLRHAMVCQFDAKLNVFAYNSSLNTQLFLGGDLLLHCNEGDAVGPMLNLMEGNIVERAKVDQKDDNWHNDKFNTYFRNRAIYSFWISRVKKEYKERQCGQNVVGCNMDPNWDPWNGSTFNKLQDYGFSGYYDSGDAWEGLPSDQISYFKQSKPAYFSSGFDWPFVPARSNVTPARDRQNQHNASGESPAVFQGLADYDLNCCPDLETYSGKIWNNETEVCKAMDEIIIDHCMVVSNNNLTFKAGSKITLTSGTHINAGNNVQIFYTNDICDWDTKEKIKDFNDIDKIANIESVSKLAGQIRIFPNPNNGTFTLETDIPIQKENIRLYDMMGRNIEFMYTNQSISLLNQYSGVLIVHINVQSEIVINRIVIK